MRCRHMTIGERINPSLRAMKWNEGGLLWSDVIYNLGGLGKHVSYTSISRAWLKAVTADGLKQVKNHLWRQVQGFLIE